MGHVGQALIASVIVAGLSVVGCGGSSTHSSPPPTRTKDGQSVSSSIDAKPPTQQTDGRSEPAPAATLEVTIPALLRESRIRKRNTCDGADVSLPVGWSHIPPEVTEIAIFVVNLQPVHGKLFFDWAVAGLSPTSHSLSPGKLPPGAVVGGNSFGKVGYSICPAKGTGKEHYVVRLVSLRRPLAAKPGFDAETLYREAERSATAVGLGGGAYTPPKA